MIVSEVASQRSMRFDWSWLNHIDRYWIKEFLTNIFETIEGYCMILQSSMHLSSSRVPALPARSLPVQGPVSLPAGWWGRHVAAPWKTMHDSNLWVQLRTAFSPKLLDCFDTFWKTPCFATDSFFGYLAVKKFPYLRFCPWIAEVYWKMA